MFCNNTVSTFTKQLQYLGACEINIVYWEGDISTAVSQSKKVFALNISSWLSKFFLNNISNTLLHFPVIYHWYEFLQFSVKYRRPFILQVTRSAVPMSCNLIFEYSDSLLTV